MYLLFLLKQNNNLSEIILLLYCKDLFLKQALSLQYWEIDFLNVFTVHRSEMFALCYQIYKTINLTKNTHFMPSVFSWSTTMKSSSFIQLLAASASVFFTKIKYLWCGLYIKNVQLHITKTYKTGPEISLQIENWSMPKQVYRMLVFPVFLVSLVVFGIDGRSTSMDKVSKWIIYKSVSNHWWHLRHKSLKRFCLVFHHQVNNCN